MLQHARTALEPGEVVHVVSWHEVPALPGIITMTLVLEATSAPGVRGVLTEHSGVRHGLAVFVGQLGKIVRGKRTRFFRFTL